MRKAGDDVHILTVDSKTAAAQLPKEYMGYPIEHTQGFTFPLYNHISLTIDLPEMKGGHILEQMKPDIIHVTSPGFLLFAAMFYARVMKIPLVMSYHTHLPSYGKLSRSGCTVVLLLMNWVMRSLTTYTFLCLGVCAHDRQELFGIHTPGGKDLLGFVALRTQSGRFDIGHISANATGIASKRYPPRRSVAQGH